MTLTGILSYLAVINLTGFAAFGIDKYKAIHHKWRIRESALLAIAILGGSVGCLIGMYVFHHKTLHPSFRIGIPMILIVELIAGCLQKEASATLKKVLYELSNQMKNSYARSDV